VSVRIAGIEFDNISYYRAGDVLYLWAGMPRPPSHDDESAEGHYLQFDEDGSLIAITIVDAQRILEREGKIVITLPGQQIEAPDLAAVLAAA
jgi:uncharacterized protein YuzE